MVEIIEAAFPVKDEPTFCTAEAAISYSKKVDQERRNIDETLYVGRHIVFADYQDSILELHLDNGKILVFQCVQNSVDIKVEDTKYNHEFTQSYPENAVMIMLAGKEINWNKHTIQSLVGNAVKRIQLSQHGCYLYVTNVGILLLEILINTRSNQPFLFWEMTD